MGHHSRPAGMEIGSDDDQPIPPLAARKGPDAIHFIHGVTDVGLDPENVDGGYAIALQQTNVVLVTPDQRDAVAMRPVVHRRRIFRGDDDVTCNVPFEEIRRFDRSSRVAGQYRNSVGGGRLLTDDQHVAQAAQDNRISEVRNWNNQQNCIQQEQGPAGFRFQGPYCSAPQPPPPGD